jgi:hypothetical protein
MESSKEEYVDVVEYSVTVDLILVSPKCSPDPEKEGAGQRAEGHPGGLEATIRRWPGGYYEGAAEKSGNCPDKAPILGRIFAQ